jgi:hydroxymethylpyrimidine/phosphomethylpyrimidine kinase
MPPVALTIAGSDSSSGAGIQADLKTFGALGVYGITAVTCVVSETPGKVSRIEPVPAEVVRDQIEVVASSFPIGAIKTGLLCSAEIVRTVARAVSNLSRVPLVVDPVFIATSGDRLLDPKAIEVYEKELFPLATLITPNLDEAGQLLEEKIDSRESMERAGRALFGKYNTNILLKGGHLSGESAMDLLVTANGIKTFAAPFVRNIATHGTGCTYSAAITAGIVVGKPLEQAVADAKKFVTKAISEHFRWGKNLDALNHGCSRASKVGG